MADYQKMTTKGNPMTDPHPHLQAEFDKELLAELDRSFLDIAKSAACRTLALIEQNKVPGYHRGPEYDADVAYLLQALTPCFSGSLTPHPSIREMADHLRGVALGERPPSDTEEPSFISQILPPKENK